jgi:hypothetical protein
MKFLILGQEAHTLPYAVSLDTADLDGALTASMEIKESNDRNLFHTHLIVNLDTGEVKRMVWDKEANGYVLIDCAFDKFGIETPNEYFTMPQTAEMSG